jgi:hypothetical protein
MAQFFALLFISLIGVSETSAQPVPTDIKSTVGFVYVGKTTQDQFTLLAHGTCFFVGVKDPQDETKHYLYTVTARHVLEDQQTHGMFDRIFIRVNTKDGQSRMVMLDLFLQGPKQNVLLHEDPTIDIAVIRGGPDNRTDDFKVIPDELIMTKDDISTLSITEGSEVFFTGLFTSHIGQKRNNPIVRFGRMALMTEEKVRWDKNQMLELYLIESASYGGNSGSPVFSFLGSERTPGTIYLGGRLIKLTGVMMGAFGEHTPIQFLETANIPVGRQSVGIAAVVPAYKLKEILFSEAAKSQRRF